MATVTEISLKRPLLIIVIFTVLILFGALSYTRLNYELLPKFDANIVTAQTMYIGASAEEVENTITKNIEEILSTVEGVDKITSSSQQNVSSVLLELKNGVDVEAALADAQRKLDQIATLLPEDSESPTLMKFSTADFPILQMGVSSNLDNVALYDLIDKQLKPQISNVEGVGQVLVIGGVERQITVNADRDKLKAYGLTIGQLSQAVNAASISTPAGSLETETNNYAITYNVKYDNVDDLQNTVIATTPTGGKIYLRDVADVQEGSEKQTAINHTNGVPSIGVMVMKQSDANSVAVSQDVQERLKSMEELYKSNNLKFTIADDQSIYTLESANAVMFDLFLAIVIVSLVMLFFLHSFRSSTFVLVALPASIIPTFIAMYVFGMSLNLMTLMGLSLVVGILVDDSIVILENIMRHMEMGKNKWFATLEGRSEIGFTAVAITMVDVVVFLPLALSGGIIGAILREFALVVVTSTLMSLFVCFTLTPLLASRFGKVVHLNPKTLWGRMNIGFENFITSMRDSYTSVLKWALKHKVIVFSGVIVLFFLAFALVPLGFIGFSFMSKTDDGKMSVKIETASQSSLYNTNQLTMEVEKILLRQPEVVHVFSNVGYSTESFGGNSSNYAEMTVQLVDKKERDISVDDFSTRMQDSVAHISGIKATITSVSFVSSGRADMQVAVKGPVREDVRVAAEKVKEIVESVNGTRYVEFSTKTPRPEIHIELDRERMALFGINASEVGLGMASGFRGNDNAKYTYQGNEYDIMVKLDEADTRSVKDIEALTFRNAQGMPVEMSQFATISEVQGESILQRMDRLPSMTVNAYTLGRSSGEIGQDISEKLDGIQLPAGTTWQFVGAQENMQDSFMSLFLALGIAILLVYFVMVALYDNAIYPFVVLFALPLALIGALFALALTREELTIFAMIGFIMLMGLVAKNGILLVDFANHRKAQGENLVQALIDAGKERFRPIMMTTLAMVFGMLPIALASGAGSEFKNGMAWVIIGGLTSSLFLTLLVVPCVYYIVDRIKMKIFARRFRKMRAKVIERNTTDDESKRKRRYLTAAERKRKFH